MIRLQSILTFLLFGTLLLIFGEKGNGLLAQGRPPVPADSTVSEQINIDGADLLRVEQLGPDRQAQWLIGNVELSQDTTYMYCDSAQLINSVQLFAYDNVIIQQGDSIAAFSNRLDYNAEEQIADLKGSVILQNGTRELYTDALRYDLTTKLATYTTGGRLTDGETELSSTLGYYYADRDEIYFRDSVVAIGADFEMRADTLKYDAANEIVYFLGPTIIRTDTAEIYCEDGYYEVATQAAVFRQNAQFKSDDQVAVADSIIYSGESQRYILSGDAYFREGDKALARADRITYDKREDTYELEGNGLLVDSLRTVRGEYVRYDKIKNTYKVSGGRPEVVDGNMILRADELDYDEATGLGFAAGAVEWRDTSAQLTIFAERAAYNQESGYLKASGGRNDRPLLITILDGDSLFLAADTLYSFREIPGDAEPSESLTVEAAMDTMAITGDTIPSVDTLTTPLDSTFTEIAPIVEDSLMEMELPTPEMAPDTQRLIMAYNDVRVYKSDMQAICDSLAFNTTDSILTLFRSPVLWQDTSQLLSDTIDVYLRDDALDKVHLKKRALVVTSPDLIFFNQVKGKDIYAYFDSSALSRTDVTGNAEAVYYAQDEEGAYIGVNKTACSEMSLDFENGGVRFIRFLTMPSGRLDPMGTVRPQAQPELEGFRWELESRPQSLDDLFDPKKKRSVGASSSPASIPEKPGRG